MLGVMMVAAIIGLGLGLAFAVALGLWFKGLHTRAALLVRAAPALIEAPQFFALLDRVSNRSHFFERHGPMLNQHDINQRAVQGDIDFSGHSGFPSNSARWYTHKDLLRAIESALSHWNAGERPSGGAFDFDFGDAIGEGETKGGSPLIRTQYARVIIRKGEIVTAFPLIVGGPATKASALR